MASATVNLLRACDVDYDAALRWQCEAADAVRAGGPEALALIEHRPVYTMGRRGGRASLAVPSEALRAPVIDVERGGDITWHGPGQLVGYPILDLRRRALRPADYVHRLEATLIDALAAFAVQGMAVPGRPGVWVDGQKVAAIGVAVRGGVTMHGFALNVAPDLGWFDAIVPCGIRDATVTSLARLLAAAPGAEVPEAAAVATAIAAAFEARFDVALRVASSAPLRAATEVTA